MTSLKEQLNNELADFKATYLKNVEAYFKAEFKRLSELTEEQVILSRGYVDYSVKKEGANRHTKASFAYWNKVQNQKLKGEQVFVEKALQNAELNFEKSIQKVIHKCKKKDLCLYYANVIYHGIGNDGNPRFDVSDGCKTVFCYTIIAFGEIQIPHYRFLIK